MIAFAIEKIGQCIGVVSPRSCRVSWDDTFVSKTYRAAAADSTSASTPAPAQLGISGSF